jgi:hypothetical protein
MHVSYKHRYTPSLGYNYGNNCLIELKIFYKLLSGFLIIKPTRCTNFSNLCWNETLHVSNDSSVHHQQFFTVHTRMVYVIQVCRQLSSMISLFHPDPACKLSAELYDIYHCWVYSEKLLMMDRGIIQNMQSFIPK